MCRRSQAALADAKSGLGVTGDQAPSSSWLCRTLSASLWPHARDQGLHHARRHGAASGACAQHAGASTCRCSLTAAAATSPQPWRS